MRPRHKAAENPLMRAIAAGHRALASMRPRHKAAENVAMGYDVDGLMRVASMRPRHKAAENRRPPPTATATSSSFNEAAA